MSAQLSLFQTMASPAKSGEAAGPARQGASAPCRVNEQEPTPRARLKHLIEELRFAQMQVRLDLSGLERSKAKARRIAAEMRTLCQNNPVKNKPRPNR